MPGGWTALDALAVGVYLAVVLGAGLWAGRRERGAADYFLAGRSLPWYLIGLSLYASNMSGASFVGLIGAAYSYGLAVYHYEWTAALALAVFAACILPVFLRLRLYTVPEYLEARYGRGARLAYAVFTLAALLLIDMAGALYAGAVVLTTAFPALGLWPASAALALLAGGYTLVGGLRAVVVTDALQAVLIIAGAAVVAGFGLHASGGWAALQAQAGALHTALLRPADDPFLPWPGIGGVVLLGLYYWGINQYFVQRALAARSLAAARQGALFGALLKLPNLGLLIIPGMAAAVLFPGLETPDQAFPVLITQLLPAGARALLLAALLAAIMSSLDSALNAAAALATMDLLRTARPDLTDRTLLRAGRAFTALLIVLAALYAPLIARFGSLFEYFQATLAYLVPAVVAVYLAGLLVARLPAAAGLPALAGGLGCGAALFVAQLGAGVLAPGLPVLHYTYAAMVVFALTLGLLALGWVRLGPAPVPASAALRREDLRPQGASSRLRDYRYQAAALAVLTVAVLAWLA